MIQSLIEKIEIGEKAKVDGQ
ncbi:MAG: hypothetical protein LBI13_00615 [Streptococcaceae bacterium]|nr:hypothetical protein [Streptococcaceae bacterium]